MSCPDREIYIVELDETVVKNVRDLFRLSPGIGPRTTDSLLSQLYTTETAVVNERVLTGDRPAYDIHHVTFPVNRGQLLYSVLEHYDLDHRRETRGVAILSIVFAIG